MGERPRRLCACRVAPAMFAQALESEMVRDVTGSSPVRGAKRKQIERSAFSFTFLMAMNHCCLLSKQQEFAVVGIFEFVQISSANIGSEPSIHSASPSPSPEGDMDKKHKSSIY